MGSEDHAAVAPLGSTGAALPGPAGMLLNPGLASATGHLRPGLGVVGALALVALVDDHGLVHQGRVHGHVEDSIVKFDAVQGVPTLIFYCYLHRCFLVLRFLT